MIVRDTNITHASDRATTVWITVGLALIPAVASGFSRFAYALVLPSMRAALHWSYGIAGALNTASAIGFLAGALVAAAVIGRLGERLTLLVTMMLTAVTVLGSGTTRDLAALAVFRIVGGITAAIAFVLGAALVARLSRDATPRRAALLLGVYFAGGGGLGVVAPGIVVPAVLTAGSWRTAWLVLGAMSIAGLLIAVPCARHVPASTGTDAGRPGLLRWPVRRLRSLLIGYGLFGAGYIAYMTFIIAYLDGRGASPTQVTVFWVVLGVAAIGGTYAWSLVLGRVHGGRGPALTLVAVSAGSALPLLTGSTACAYVSAVIFGGSFLATPASVAGCAREVLPRRYWTGALAALTGTFALGQCVGPVLAGMLSDGTAGVRAGLLIGAAILLVSIGVTAGQPRGTNGEARSSSAARSAESPPERSVRGGGRYS